MNVDDYIIEANRQLDNTEFYTKLGTNPTTTHNDIVNSTIQKFVKEKLLPEHVAKALCVDNPKTARFYLLPKVHKDNIPGRPITNAIDSPTSSIAEFVDYQLQPIVQKLKSYIKDTTDFITKLEKIKELPKGAILVTLDVKSLYTNIPHNEGINAVARYLEDDDSVTTSTRVILKFLSLVLNLNNFTFNDENILQIKGCSMGAKCSCTYANMFMGKFEEDKIYQLIENKVLCYYRFVDDIFMIWKETETDLKNFFSKLNSLHPNIKFDCKFSSTEINFLDTTVCINNSNKITIRLYKKDTDRNAYLHYKSYHPCKLKDNIPFGQALRVKKICSENSDLENALTDLKTNFVNRGYPQKIVETQVNKTRYMARSDILKPKEKPNNNRLHFCMTYNKNLPQVRNILDKHWHLLQTNNKISSAFNQKPMITYRRNRNLRDLIGQTHLSKNKKITGYKKKSGKSSACLSRANNLCCKQVVDTNKFQSDNTGKTYYIRHFLNCHSRNVTYLGYCILCPRKQYIGKTEPPVHLRINNHRYAVKDPKGIAFDKHFDTPGHNFNEHARFILIEQLRTTNTNKETTTQLLEQREDFWMQELKTIVPYGLNIQLNSAVSNQIRVICS